MSKLKNYYKPYILSTLLVICLLFVQALCDLELPDYMSYIVNTGIQAGGIEKSVPEVISNKGLEFITYFMEEQDKQLIYDNYTKIVKQDENYIKEYPLLENEDIYMLKNVDEEIINNIDGIFKISSKTIINVFTETSSQENQKITDNESSSIEISKMYEMLDLIKMVPQSVIENARNQAIKTDSTMLDAIGKTFVKSYYKEIGLDTNKIQNDYILQIGLKMIIITLIGMIAAIIVGYFASKIAAGFSRDLRKDLFEKVEEFSNNEFDKFSTSSLITRTTNDINQIQNVIVMGLRILLYAPILGVGGVIMILQKNPSMTWILGVALLGVLTLVLFLLLVALPKFKIMQKLIDKLNLVSRENLTGIMVSRAFGNEEYEEERFDKANLDLSKTNLFVNKAMAVMVPTMTLIMNIISVLIVWVGANKIAQSSLQVGDMMAFLQYAMQVIMSCLMVSMIFIMIPRASVSANRIKEVLETTSDIKDPKNPKEIGNTKKVNIEFKNVFFKYKGADENVLENISFTAKSGETTAFIGSTGSGKSTLINLIPRFYDVTEGSILINGIDIRDITLKDLYNEIGYIPQKASLLSGTIESNLKYGNSKATNEFMEECAKVAQATDFIESKKEKYKANISQNAKNISGGQKQRISIARALVKNSPIYIFDDSFSALDFKTDAKLRTDLKKHTNDSTILIVAQRVNTIINADQIIVLDKGKIVGKGTHEELLKKCPIYYEIALSQLSEEELKKGGNL